ncbi:MAG: TonB-dependent receptor [Bacteroidales bacterium]|nr:TonB-dependent receptor [Bacteroidales bacterium]
MMLPNGALEFDLTLGYNQYHRYRSYSEDEIKGLVLEQSFPNLANTTATPSVTAGFPSELWRRQGVYGIFEAGFNDFIFLTATARNTWSSALPKENNSYFYPSVSLSFIASDAFNFDNNLEAIDMLKLRAAYGKAGNDANPYVIYPDFVEGQVTGGIPFSDLTFPLNNVRGYEYDNVLGNLNLQPEISTDYEVGVDISLFNYRLALEATYYDRTTEGMILPRTVASSSGFRSLWDNIGKIQNNGFEMGLGITPLRLKAFSWDMSYNFSQN